MRQLIQDPDVPPAYSRDEFNCTGIAAAQASLMVRRLRLGVTLTDNNETSGTESV